MGVSVRQQKRDGVWYVFIRHNGERAAQKCVDEQHAIDTQKAVSTAIAAGTYDLAALKRQYEQCVKDPVISLLQKDVMRSVRQDSDEQPAEKDERKLSKDSIRNVVAALPSMLNEAVERKLLSVNPATKFGETLQRSQFGSRTSGSVQRYRFPRPLHHRSAPVQGWRGIADENQKDSEWVFMTPGKIEWSAGDEGKRGGRKPIGHKEGRPVDMKNFRNRVFMRACDRAGIRRRRCMTRATPSHRFF